jgi:hypothetical protein
VFYRSSAEKLLFLVRYKDVTDSQVKMTDSCVHFRLHLTVGLHCAAFALRASCTAETVADGQIQTSQRYCPSTATDDQMLKTTSNDKQARTSYLPRPIL